MKKSPAMVLIGLFGCQSGQIELSGEAISPGNPAKFVELCEKGDATALALLKATEVGDCKGAGEVLANVAKVDFNRSALEEVSLDALDSLSNIERLEAYGKGIVDVTAVSGLVRLERLYLMQNNIVDISPLET